MSTSLNIRPVLPSEVQEVKNSAIPPEIVEIVNQLIVQNWDGSSATFKQEEVVKLAEIVLNSERSKLFTHRWLDFEDLFRRVGWEVDYDKPGYNETYDATFTFTKKRKGN
jgi:hypothetical protein